MPSTVFVLLDGIGDVNIPDLGNISPLTAAWTPTLDAVAGKGSYVFLTLACCKLACFTSRRGSPLSQVRDSMASWILWSLVLLVEVTQPIFPYLAMTLDCKPCHT